MSSDRVHPAAERDHRDRCDRDCGWPTLQAVTTRKRPEKEATAPTLATDVPSLDFAWGLATAWSETAGSTKKLLTRARAATLVLLVAGAGAGAIGANAAPVDRSPGWAVGAAIALGFAGMLEGFVVTPDRNREWAVARMASETLVAAVWAYLTSLPPYDGTEDEKADALRATIEKVELTKGATRATGPIATPLPSIEGDDVIELYQRERAQGQLEWHRDNGAKEAKKGGLFRGIVLFLTASGAVLLALSSIEDLFDSPLSAWVALLTTATAAITTHSRAARFQEVAAGYERTSVGLELEMHRFSQVPDQQADFPTLVANVERILARQNESWVETVDG